MSKSWTIQRITGLDTMGRPIVEDVTTSHDLEFHGEWMADSFVTVNVRSAEPIDWHFDDYLEYRGEKFSISYDPNVVKKARRGTYGEGFTYDNIKFYALSYKTGSYGFKDVVLADNHIPYTSLATFSFFCSSVEDFADRLAANFEREQQSLLLSSFIVLTPSQSRTMQRYGGILPVEWSRYYDGTEDTGETDVNIDIDKQSCREVMKYVYEKFGLSYYMTGNIIVIGGKPMQVNSGDTSIFRYGKGLGLYEIERTSDEDQEIVTKLFAYGSEKNLPLNYYANSIKVFYGRVTEIISKDSDQYNYAEFTLDIPYRAGMFNVKNIGPTGEYQVGWVTMTSIDGIEIHTKVENLSADIWPNVRIYCEFRTSTEDEADEPDLSKLKAYINALEVGKTVVFTMGFDKNKWPQDHITTEDSESYPALLSVNRLMLPGFPTQSLQSWVINNADPAIRSLVSKYIFSTDKHDPWIMSRNIDGIGLREGNTLFDGSSQEEIYPTLEEATDSSGNRLDEVSYADQMEDNGYLGDNPESNDLQFEVMPMGLASAIDWYDHDEEMIISMKDGACVGRKFKVKGVKKNTNGDWVLTLERERDSSTGRYFPYKESSTIANLFQVMGRGNYQGTLPGDHFVVTGINMQKAYVDAAAKKLLIASCGWLDKHDHMRYTYLPKIDEIFMQRDHDERGGASYYMTINAGMRLEFEDSDLGIHHSPYIDQLTIKENGNNGIPTYDVVLRDEKEKGTLEKLTEDINDLVANPPIQVVERQQRVLQYVEYDSWEEGRPYYFETLNTATDVLETSEVWHRGCLWKCLRTLTQDEPWFTSSDWECLRATNLALNFFDTNVEDPQPITVVQIYPKSVDFTVVPYLLIGNEDITEENVTAWKWTRQSENTAQDENWNSAAKTSQRQMRITKTDLPTGYKRGDRLSFTCTATLAFEYGGSETIINRVNF